MLAQARERLARLVVVAHQRALGDLDLERALLEAHGEPLGLDHVGEARVEQHARRHVHGDRREEALVAASAGSRVAAISSASSVSGSARPVRSASGTNVAGSTGPTTGSVQRASASTPTTRAGRELHLRLVVHRDRADVDRALERRDEDQPARRLVLDVGREELAARLRALGAVHGGLGALEEEVGVVRVRWARRRCRSWRPC